MSMSTSKCQQDPTSMTKQFGGKGKASVKLTRTIPSRCVCNIWPQYRQYSIIFLQCPVIPTLKKCTQDDHPAGQKARNFTAGLSPNQHEKLLLKHKSLSRDQKLLAVPFLSLGSDQHPRLSRQIWLSRSSQVEMGSTHRFCPTTAILFVAASESPNAKAMTPTCGMEYGFGHELVDGFLLLESTVWNLKLEMSSKHMPRQLNWTPKMWALQDQMPPQPLQKV